jgi:CRISPR system Cascade subunit CasB
MSQTDHPLAEFVGGRVASLSRRYLANESAAVAQLARLRRAIPTRGELAPETWELLSEDGGFPITLTGSGDVPSRAELAAAAALTLFALHQQSGRLSVHSRGPEHALGRAAFELRPKTDSGGVERRMQALNRATSTSQLLEHLRGLITLMRSHQVQLDYARLAMDLYRVQTTDGRRAVRMQWSRDFYRPPARPTDDTDTSGDPA